jgi:hypothetical protein
MPTFISKRTKWIGSFLLFISGIAVLVTLSGGSSGRAASRDVSVTLLGFTNGAGGGRCAVLTITNTSNRRVALMVDSFEESVSGAWTTSVSPGFPASRLVRAVYPAMVRPSKGIKFP